jgi:hypothetical protein
MHTILALAVLAVIALAARFALRLLSFASQRGGQRVERAIAYGPLPLQAVDIHAPQSVDAATPVVVFFHGGGWSRGSAADYGFVGASIARAGMIAAVADYRLIPPCAFPISWWTRPPRWRSLRVAFPTGASCLPAIPPAPTSRCCSLLTGATWRRSGLRATG